MNSQVLSALPSVWVLQLKDGVLHLILKLKLRCLVGE